MKPISLKDTTTKKGEGEEKKRKGKEKYRPLSLMNID